MSKETIIDKLKNAIESLYGKTLSKVTINEEQDTVTLITAQGETISIGGKGCRACIWKDRPTDAVSDILSNIVSIRQDSLNHYRPHPDTNKTNMDVDIITFVGNSDSTKCGYVVFHIVISDEPEKPLIKLFTDPNTDVITRVEHKLKLCGQLPIKFMFYSSSRERLTIWLHDGALITFDKATLSRIRFHGDTFESEHTSGELTPVNDAITNNILALCHDLYDIVDESDSVRMWYAIKSNALSNAWKTDVYINSPCDKDRQVEINLYQAPSIVDDVLLSLHIETVVAPMVGQRIANGSTTIDWIIVDNSGINRTTQQLTSMISGKFKNKLEFTIIEGRAGGKTNTLCVDANSLVDYVIMMNIGAL